MKNIRDKLSINEDKIKENLKLKIINEKQEIEEYQYLKFYLTQHLRLWS